VWQPDYLLTCSNHLHTVAERYEIHLKRYELSDDFSAQMTIKQLDVDLARFGQSRSMAMDTLKKSLELMEKEAEAEPW